MKTYYEDSHTIVYNSDALTALKAMPSESVDICMTSPPYFGLRAYYTEPQIWGGDPKCEHKFNIPTHSRRNRSVTDIVNLESKQATNFASVFDNINTGSFCINCGAWQGELGLEPTFQMYIDHLIMIFDEVKRVLKRSGTCWVNIDDSYSGSNNGSNDYRPDGTSISANNNKYGQHKPGKTTVPTKSLIGIPERFAIAMTDHEWIRRNTVIWWKPNPMPESVKDRFTNDFEYLYFFSKSSKYYFEQQFEPQDEASLLRAMRGWNGDCERDYPNGPQSHINRYFNKTKEEIDQLRIQGRNKRCVWNIPTEPSGEDHYAAYPEKLCEIPILAGCPKNGTCLDPFAGTGTTGCVAKRLGRHSILIEISPKYCKIIKKRVSNIPIPMEL